MKLLNLEAQGERANKALGEFGLEKTSVVLAEGFCPVCMTRSSTALPDFEPDEEDRPSSATVRCAKCQIVWRTGPNLDSTIPVWVEHTREWFHEGEHSGYLTFNINPPAEPEPEEDWWDEEA